MAPSCWGAVIIGIAAVLGVELRAGEPGAGPDAAPQPAPAVTPAASDAQLEEFFERRVRPILAKKCQDCHGPQKQELGLRLDSREGLQQGATSGSVVVPGQPDASRLIQVVTYASDVQMPPEGKLADDEIAILADWVRQGAPWPAAADAGTPSAPANGATAPSDAGWAFVPPRVQELPAIQQADWPTGRLDTFILARLEAAGLGPAPESDRRTLLRRVTFDLTGLPPTLDELRAFEADVTADAWPRVVERLLASPHYGERWGRHWLDLARYADTKGYVFTADPRYHYAYTYRDYVIRSLNDDLPYDQFVREQIAADLLPESQQDPRKLAALGFLTLGRRFDNNIHDIIDDRIDVIGRGLLGLSVSCARCHDHKYDPIPTAEYYGLHGVFASCVEPDELPLIAEPEESAAFAAAQQQVEVARQALARFIADKRQSLEAHLRRRVGDYLGEVAREMSGMPDDKDLTLLPDPDDLRPARVAEWRRFLTDSARQTDPVFWPWQMALDGPPEEAAVHLAAVRARLEEEARGTLDPTATNARVREGLLADFPTTLLALASRYGDILGRVVQDWERPRRAAALATLLGRATSAPEHLPDAVDEQLRGALWDEHAPTRVVDRDVRDLLILVERHQLVELRRNLESLEESLPGAPARAHVLRDADTPVAPRILLRGNPNRLGDEVPRGFLSVASGQERRLFQQGSGRRELAEAIVAPENPLAARVIVNRVWQHHFGRGLVGTPSDFGARGEHPSHPELLDDLAARWVAHRWSLKWLHREILLSRTYRQASQAHEHGEKVDPENRLLWRMNRRRLDFEEQRDAMLVAAGRLDPTVGGRPFQLLARPYSGRRSLYAYVDRQDLTGVLRVFDYPNPDSSAAERPQTTVPQQALFAMNSPLVQELAQQLAARPEITQRSDDAGRIAALYELVYTRSPDAEERQRAAQYVALVRQQARPAAQAVLFGGKASPSPLDAWGRLAQVLLVSNEFVFVD